MAFKWPVDGEQSLQPIKEQNREVSESQNSDSAREENAMKEHCAYIKQLLGHFENADSSKMSEDVKKEIRDIKDRMSALKLVSRPEKTKEEPEYGDERSKSYPKFEPERTEKKGSRRSEEEEEGVVSRRHDYGKNRSESKSNKSDREKHKWRKPLTESSDSSSSYSGSGEESCSEDISRERVKQRRKKTAYRSSRNHGNKHIQVLSNKIIPEFEKYDENSGESLMEYLERFERFCQRNVNGDEDSWIGELKKKLSGDTLRAFNNMRESKDTYVQLRYKLEDWDEEMKVTRKKKARSQFKKMKPEKKEPVHSYCYRLEKVFKLAYPKHKMEKSSTLREKFLQTVPKSFLSLISDKLFSDKVDNKVTKWSTLKRYARVRDVEVDDDKSTDSSDDQKDEEIIINIQREQDAKPSGEKYGHNQDNGNSSQQPMNRQPDHYKNQYSQSQNYQKQFRPRFYNNSNQHRSRQQPSGNFNPRNQNANQQRQQNHNNNQNSQASRPPAIISCEHCGRLGHVEKNCRRLHKLCFNCGLPNHVTRFCRFHNRNPPHNRSQSQPPANRNKFNQHNNNSNNDQGQDRMSN